MNSFVRTDFLFHDVGLIKAEIHKHFVLVHYRQPYMCIVIRQRFVSICSAKTETGHHVKPTNVPLS